MYYPDTAPVPESAAVNVRGRSYKILADVEITDPNCSGVIFAHGSRFGGHGLFVEDQKLFYVYNFSVCGDGLCVGHDSADAVSEKYTSPAEFKGGTIVVVTISRSWRKRGSSSIRAKQLLRCRRAMLGQWSGGDVERRLHASVC